MRNKCIGRLGARPPTLPGNTVRRTLKQGMCQRISATGAEPTWCGTGDCSCIAGAMPGGTSIKERMVATPRQTLVACAARCNMWSIHNTVQVEAWAASRHNLAKSHSHEERLRTKHRHDSTTQLSSGEANPEDP